LIAAENSPALNFLQTPFINVRLEAQDRVLRISLYNYKYLWFPYRGHKNLLDVKKEIQLADLDVAGGSLLDKKKLPKQEELFEFIRFLDLENLEIADATGMNN